MTDLEFAVELRRHLLALASCETHPVKRRALHGVVATIEKRYGVLKRTIASPDATADETCQDDHD